MVASELGSHRPPPTSATRKTTTITLVTMRSRSDSSSSSSVAMPEPAAARLKADRAPPCQAEDDGYDPASALVELGAAARAELRLLGLHAGDDTGHVGDIRAAQPECIAGAGGALLRGRLVVGERRDGKRAERGDDRGPQQQLANVAHVTSPSVRWPRCRR